MRAILRALRRATRSDPAPARPTPAAHGGPPAHGVAPVAEAATHALPAVFARGDGRAVPRPGERRAGGPLAAFASLLDTRPRARAVAAALAAALAGAAAAQDLRGHGGPVGALAARDGRVLSGSFDTRAILWDRDRAAAVRVTRLHEGPVTAVALLPDGRLATGGQDGRVAVWGPAGTTPERVDPAHQGPVSAIAASPDGATLASVGWDGALRLTPPAGGAAATVAAHGGKATGLGWLSDGRLVTVGSDLRLRVWDGARLSASVDLPAPPNAAAAAGDAAAVAFADGSLRLVGPEGVRAERRLSERPLTAVAAQGGRLAVAALDGTAWALDAATLEVRMELRPTGQWPLWSVALDGSELLTGGGDGVVRRWSAATGEALGPGGTAAAGPPDDGSRGAQVWRACAVCHALSPDDGARAGPTLHGVFGRRIGTAPGYDYSAALRALDIVWTPETVAALFEHGPEAYTPGSRMPEQRLPDPEDRAALVDFLARHGG
jgi:cytochrome c